MESEWVATTRDAESEWRICCQGMSGAVRRWREQSPRDDAALLDVNVAGRQVFPVAEALKERGVPFVFSTGYGEGGLPDEWRGQPTIQKPFTEAAIRDALMKAMGVAEA